ncbi:MAG: sugar phosphate isomerase/epimerase family protein [Halobacteriaceae archaeon]
MRLGVQPFTVRDIDEPLADKVRRIAAAGYEAVELSPDDADDPAVRDALEETGLAVSSLGVGEEDLEDPDRLAEAAETLGCEYVVLMYLGEDRWASESAARETAAFLDDAAADLAERGLTFCYHNHAHEFVDLGDTTAYEQVVADTDRVQFELDLGWVGTGGLDPVALLSRLGDRVPLVHVKDMDFAAGEFVTFGEGDLDVAAALAEARDRGVEYALFENDQPEDPVAELSHARVVISGHL